MMKNKLKSMIVILTLILMGCPWTLFAYVGPGPGLSFLTTLFGLLAAICTSIFLVVLWPIRRVLKRRKEKKENQEKSSE